MQLATKPEQIIGKLGSLWTINWCIILSKYISTTKIIPGLNTWIIKNIRHILKSLLEMWKKICAFLSNITSLYHPVLLFFSCSCSTADNPSVPNYLSKRLFHKITISTLSKLHFYFIWDLLFYSHNLCYCIMYCDDAWWVTMVLRYAKPLWTSALWLQRCVALHCVSRVVRY